MPDSKKAVRAALTRLEQNVNARLSLHARRQETLEENHLLLQTELSILKRLFNNVSEVYESLQAIIVRLKNGR